MLSNSQTPHTLTSSTVAAEKACDAPAVSNTSRNALDGPAWRSFLDVIVVDDPISGARVGGRPLNLTNRRQLHRWRFEHALPSIWSADHFLTLHGLYLDAFFHHAERMGRSPWALGWAPAWHDEDWIHEDVNWCDPDDPFQPSPDGDPIFSPRS